MKPTARLPRPLAWLAFPACALCAVLTTSAQTAPVSPTPAELAKYDTNRNGRLDPAELAALRADAGATSAAKPVTPTDDVLQLSPFTVATTKDAGYFAENTLAGSRLNTNLADLAASITVVTKQQMDDTASLDINDVFKYEASTEGSNTYTPSIVDRGTAKDAVAGYSFGNNGDSTTNAQANRVRGLAAPDAAINNFPTNNRVPFDSYNTQSVEITRGPNSLLFGLGSPSGIVNQTAAQAQLNRTNNQVVLRTDQYGTFRTSLSFNRPLIKDKLAVYGAFLYNNQQFERKPSRDLTRRQYGAITYKPFSKTVFRGFAENYRNDSNRPNSLTPRDFVTPWLQAGRPAYDPTTRMITVLDTNRVYGPYVSNVNSPGYNAAVNTVLGAGAPSTVANNPLFVGGIQFEDTARPLRLIDGGSSIAFFQRNPVLYAPAQTNPATATPTPATLGWVPNDPRYLMLDRQWSSSVNFPVAGTVINGRNYTYGSYQLPGVTNKSIYDWTKYNHLQTNFAQSRSANYNLEVEQQLLPNLFFSAGWMRQDIDGFENYTMNQLTGATIQIDTNQKRIDGTPNPYFGLPFVSEGVGGGLDTFFTPQTDDNYRAMLAYDLDLTKQNKWISWLGRHRLLGLWSKQHVNRAVERWRNGFVDGDADARLRYVSNLTIPGTQQALSTALMRKYYMSSPGAPQAVSTHSSGFYGNQGWNQPITSQIQVYNYNTGQFQNDSVTEQALFSSAGSFRTRREVKSWSLAAQSYLWDERLITTLGWRHDDYRARITTPGAITDVLGKVTEPALPNDQLFLNNSTGIINHDRVMSRWGRWDALKGDTKTIGGAFRPLKGLEFVKRVGGGSESLASELLQSLTLYYNKSDNFNPPSTYQTDYFFKPLAKPTGNGRDGGFGFTAFKNKLVVRVNWYETESQNERTGAANTLLTRLAYSDTTTGIPWASAVQRIRNGIAAGRTLDQIIAVNNWNSDAVNPVNDPANQQKIYDLIKLPLNYYSGLSSGATQDSKSKGMEIQLTYNPTNNWTMKFTGSKGESTYTNIAPQYEAWLAERLPKWQTNAAPEIPDFIDPTTQRRWSLKNFWTGYGYTGVAQVENTDGNTSAQAYFNNVVQSQVALAKALEGARSPLERQYHATFLTNYTFREGRFKGFAVGGAQRWESRAAIGFFGKVGDPINSPTVINLNDVTRPVYDSGNYYTDLWVSYSRRIFRDKIGWKLQLNVNNATEDGRLMPTQVNFDGTPWAYRIIDSRQFILTSTFTF
ncbi:TonB-dependent receptor plug domain-containing protein [Horticoccus sp. 23ND18S-11]|uniref:TonB-dependent receptor plug domain-containing protein n=1 Tax=Horticoccus sp. 23ND18S-11 TaxID=3391832 RepID=UPI0039C9D815